MNKPFFLLGQMCAFYIKLTSGYPYDTVPTTLIHHLCFVLYTVFLYEEI